LEPLEVLRTYKDQPYLEKHFSTKKSVLEVAPAFLERPQRIAAMMSNRQGFLRGRTSGNARAIR